MKDKQASLNKIHKPAENVPAFYQHYIALVPDDENLMGHLQDIRIETENLVKDLSEDKLSYRYDIGKWTIKGILVHLADCERIFVYRAARIARGDKTDLPGFDEKLFAQNSNADSREIHDILEEMNVFRKATIVFIKTLSNEQLDKEGSANGFPMTTRLLVNHIYGHHRHHLEIIKGKYL
jgi:uncharacterized damage-inducible protein DinB